MNDDVPTVYYPLSVLNELMQEDEVAQLRAEVERLRHDLADLQMLRDEHLMDTENAYEEAINNERAAVVAWLREEYDTHSTQDAADHIERGEHRREEKP